MLRYLMNASLLVALLMSLGAGAPATDQAVPPALEPLKAKIAKRGAETILSFRAEEPITEEQWKAIEGLGIRSFTAGGKGLDDAALARLVKLDPEGLVLDGAALTDDGCKYLAQMKSLRSLNIGHTTNRFTGAGLSQLKELPKLEKFGFGGTSAGDAAMNAIGELTQLKEFSSWHTHFTLASNPALAKLTQVTTLTIGNSMPTWDGKPRQLSLTDATLPMIAQMISLENLTLMQARFTLPALEQLKTLPKLKTLHFDNVDIDPADVEKLRSELTNAKIEFKPVTEEKKKKLDEFLTGPTR